MTSTEIQKLKAMESKKIVDYKEKLKQTDQEGGGTGNTVKAVERVYEWTDKKQKLKMNEQRRSFLFVMSTA